MHKSLGAATIAMPLPAWVIGSFDPEGKPNAMTASWTGICCSKPPMVYFSARKATYTHGSVMQTRAFTINIASASQAAVVDYFGTASGRDTNKLAEAGVTAQRSELVDAPYLLEFPLVLECKVAQVLELGLHTMFVSEILDVKCREEFLNANGKPDTTKIAPFIYSPPDRSYLATSELLGKGYKLGSEVGKGE